MIKILIADDHAIVREGLKKIIAQTSEIIVEDEATNGAGGIILGIKLIIAALTRNNFLPGPVSLP